MKKSKVYTKTGDKGITSLIGGTRVSKTDARLEAYGTIDELNANLGVLTGLLTHDHDRQFVIVIQHKLFSIGAHLATDRQKTDLAEVSIISPSDIDVLEREIDAIDSVLPPLTHFIIPGGNQASGVCHVCRTVCRRAERRILDLPDNRIVSLELIAYVNRLSDYLFILSRKINVDLSSEEIFWNNSCV
jgi:cob(I)alamin adenosyltransferase